MGRLHYIDHLRVLVNLLIVFNHALWNRYWDPFVSGGSKVVLEILRDFSMHLAPLRVPFFFLIAGYFSLLAVNKSGVWGFVQTRVKRIALPLMVAALSYSYVVVAFNNYVDAEALWDVHKYAAYVGAGFHGFSYTWFLYVLLLFSGILVVGFFVLSGNCVGKWLGRTAEFVLHHRYLFLMTFVGLEAAKMVMLVALGKVHSGDIRFLPLDNLIENSTYFLMGMVVAAGSERYHERMVFRLREIAGILVGYGLLGIWGHMLGFGPAFLAYSVLSNAVPLVLVLAIAHRWFSGRNRLTEAIAGSTYTIYLIHFPVICLIGWGLLEVGLPILWVVAVVFVVSYPISLGLARWIQRHPVLCGIFGAKALSR